MKKITTGFEIVDSANSVQRCFCSEVDGHELALQEAVCGCQCGCKGPSSDVDNMSANSELSGEEA